MEQDLDSSIIEVDFDLLNSSLPEVVDSRNDLDSSVMEVDFDCLNSTSSSIENVDFNSLPDVTSSPPSYLQPVSQSSPRPSKCVKI